MTAPPPPRGVEPSPPTSANVQRRSSTITYDRQEMLRLSRFGFPTLMSAETLAAIRDLGLLCESDGRDWLRKGRRWKDGKRVRGCRAGVRRKLRDNPFRSPLPSVLLANGRLLRPDLGTGREAGNCCVLVLTGTGLDASVPDSELGLDGLSSFRADSSCCAPAGKTGGGGLCIYTNNNWCNNAALVSSHCSEHVELMVVRCRPFYLPREFTIVIVTAVHVPPNADTDQAVTVLHRYISEVQSRHPEGVFILAGDFNGADVTSVLPDFHQQVNLAESRENTPGCVYTNVKNAFRAVSHHGSALSDHQPILLLPIYKPPRPVVKEVRVWPQGAMSALQDCFESTEWSVFREAATDNQHIDIEEYASSVSGYIHWCMDEVTVKKTIVTPGNQKPWMNKEVRASIRERSAAFKSGDAEALKSAKRNVKNAVRVAKQKYSQRVDASSRQMSKENQCEAPEAAALRDASSFPDEFSEFLGWFEKLNTAPAGYASPQPDEHPLKVEVTASQTQRALRRVSTWGDAGPDDIPGRLIKQCAPQLAPVLTDIYNTTVNQAGFHRCYK